MTTHRFFQLVAPFVAIGTGVLAAGAAQAQQASMFGNTSSFNSLTSPNGTSVMSGASSAAFGMSARSTMPPSMGMGGMGMNGAGMNGMGSAMSMNGQMGTSLMNGQSSFLGSTSTQNGMVGAAPQQGLNGQNRNQQGMNRNNNQGRNNQARGSNRGNNNAQQQQFTNQGGQRGNSQRSIRPQLKVAFKSPSPIAATTQKNLNVRFNGLSKREGLGGVSVDVDGGKVTLRGQVDSEDSRKLAAMLVGLEPGVRSVQNDLTVSPAAPVENE